MVVDSVVLLQLLAVCLSLGTVPAQTNTSNGTTVIALDSPETTCLVLEDIAADLEERAEGSACTVRDDDQDSCNDCLWLNCTTALSSALGTVHVAFTSRFLPCYSYNDSADINIHATNTTLFSGMFVTPLTTLLAERTDAARVTVDLAGFPGNYIVEFVVEQLGHGIIFGVEVSPAFDDMLQFIILEPTYIPLSCTTRNVSECAMQGSAQYNGLGPTGIAGAVIGTLFGTLVLVLIAAVLAVLLLRRKKKIRYSISYTNRMATQDNEYHNGLKPYPELTMVDRKLPETNELEQSFDPTVLDDDADDDSLSPYMVFQPKYGVSVPKVDFHTFNITRKEAGVDEWEYPRERLTYMRELGEGQFGKVILMKAKSIAGYHGNIPVAVKTLSSTDPEDRKKFAEETELMKTFSHRNIVSLLGTCQEEEDGAPMIILELMPYGDLKDFLVKQKENESMVTSICEFEVYQIASGIASALEFLAENKYVHRDIAARNCLVGEGMIVKLADFGLARAVHDDDTYRLNGPAKLPLRWMAPESITYGIFTTQTDTWSFGVLLYEIVTFGEVPFEDLGVQDIVSNSKAGTLRLPRPADCPEQLHYIMHRCQEPDPEDRPSFSAIRYSLRRQRLKTRNERRTRRNSSGQKMEEREKGAEDNWREN